MSSTDLGEYQTPERMALKRQAIELPPLTGKSVLDVGCDHGYWCWLAAEEGASDVLGLDRGRDVRNVGFVDLVDLNRRRSTCVESWQVCRFDRIDLGKQWRAYGRFDVVLMLSLYHHVFENCGDHLSIWFWLWRHTAPGGYLIWENPIDDTDGVVRRNVSEKNRQFYNERLIIAAAETYFDIESIDPALHEPTRIVWVCRPKPLSRRIYRGLTKDGAGGASKAFLYSDSRRIREFERILGYRPFPGSLNIELSEPFDWTAGYYRAQLLDVVDRKAGLDLAWTPRWARIYPVTVDNVEAHVFRFEGETYPNTFVELISSERLRNWVVNPVATVAQ